MRVFVSVATALLVAAGVGVLLLRNASHSNENQTRSAQIAELEQKLNAATVRADELEQAVAKADAENRELEARLVAAHAEAAEPAAPAPSAPPGDEAPKQDEQTESRERSLEEIRERLRNNPAATAQLTALTELMYADLLNILDLNPEEKTALRQLLVDSMMESMALGQYALSQGDFLWSEVRGWELEERAYLDAKVRELLSNEQAQTWNEYFSQMDARQLEGNLRNQIAAVASGLTQENFDYVLQVAVEEFRAQQAALEQSNELFTLAENIQYQLRAMEAMRARLSAVLPPDQLAEIENWLSMAERLLGSQLPQDE